MIKNKEFNKSRLKSAREYRVKTIEQFAKEVKINILSLEKFESGQSYPTIEEMLKICRVLNFSKDYFYEDDNVDITVERTYFSKHSSQYRKEEFAEIEKMKLTHKLFSFIERYISFPKINIFQESSRSKNIEYVVDKFRKHYELGGDAIYNMVSFAEVNGFIVSDINTKKSSVGPFIQKSKIYDISRYFIVLGKDKKSVPKRNYDIAVQIGHIVLHELCVNENELTSKEYINIREEAREFASCLLLPKENFTNDLKYPSELDYYVNLKAKYIVPIGIMVSRAYNLGIINNRKYEYLVKEMEKKGWDKKEPLEDIKGANPIISKKAIDIMIENSIINNTGLVAILSKEGLTLPQEEIEDLLGLKRGKLSVKLKSKNKNKDENVTVINFLR
ncbi:MAG: ImmA/IrrE family metallo-endopeptidase [Romboutsia sp.]